MTTKPFCEGCEMGLPITATGNHYHGDGTLQAYAFSPCTSPKPVESERWTPRTDAICAFHIGRTMGQLNTDLENHSRQLERELRELEYSFDCHKNHVEVVNAHATNLERELAETQESLRKVLARYEWVWGNCEVRFAGFKVSSKEEIESQMPDDIR